MPLLPISVQNQGITIRKKTPDILMVISLYSPRGRYDGLYLSSFAQINLYDPLLRVDGVSDISILGEPQYSMRAWLDPQKLAAHGMNATDVAVAVAKQNLQAAPGRIGQPPSSKRQAFDLTLDTLGRLTYPEQFGDIIVKVSNPAPMTTALAKPPVFSGATPLPVVGAKTGPAGLPGFPLLTNSNPMASKTKSGGATTGGGATSSGGGTTSGGGVTGGGGMTGGGATGGGGTTGNGSGTKTANTPGTNVNAGVPPTGMGIPGLSINTSTGGNGTNGGTPGGGGLPGPQLPATAIVRLRDVARLELGALNYNQSCTFDGHPSAGLAIFLLPGTNALTVAERVRARMEELKERFPDDIDYAIAYDTTPFIRESIGDVVHTLLLAVFLVGVVVFVFLQNWRAVLIPMLAVPVAIVGTFAVLAAVGFSLNNISLFGLVLAIGIVVDDAIVVVENVERWLAQGFTSRDAARKAMAEVSGPVIAVALVLCAVFVPCTFISGITGRFFRQFAVTIAASTVFSALNSLTLSPALAALLLRPQPKIEDRGSKIEDRGSRSEGYWRFSNPQSAIFDSRFLSPVQSGIRAATAGYAWIIGRLLRVNLLVLLAYGGLLILTYVVFTGAPTGFVPQQDQGRLIAAVQLPDSAALWRTRQTVAQAEQLAHQIPGVAHTVTISGMSFVQQAAGSNLASVFIVLDPYRSGPLRTEVPTRSWPDCERRGGRTFRMACWRCTAPADPGAERCWRLQAPRRRSRRPWRGQLAKGDRPPHWQAARQHGLTSVSTVFRSDIPQLFLDIDRKKVVSLGVSFDDLNTTLGIYLGSLYVNRFDEFGRDWQVTLQAEGKFRSRIDDLNLLYVRNNQGLMVPLGTLVTVREIGGPLFVQRYNLYTAAPITGALLPGTSSGQAITTVDALANETLPRLHGHRVDRVDRTANPGGQHHGPGVRAGGPGRLPGAGGSVRKLVVAVGGYPGGAVVFAVLGGRGVVRAPVGGYFRANRPGGVGGLGVQECHPHRRVRQTVALGRQATVRGDGGGIALAPATDLDDILRLYPGRLAVGNGHGRGCRNAALTGNGGIRRHARGDVVRHLSDAGVLLRSRGVQRIADVLHATHAPFAPPWCCCSTFCYSVCRCFCRTCCGAR